jgi:NitT/TauT family transport system substrate-binding protein
MSVKITRRQASQAILGAGALLSGGGAAFGQAGLRQVTYGISTSQITQGYTFATLPVALGYLKEEGIDIKFLNATTSTMLQLMASGQAEIAAVTPEGGMAARVKTGLAIKSFYAVARRSPYHVAVNVDSPIKEIKDLKGKKIGTSTIAAPGTLYLVRRLQQEAGIGDKEVDMLAVGNALPAMEALARGRVDALVSYDSVFAGMTNAGYKYRYLPESPDDKKYYGYNLYAKDSFIRDNPDIIAKIGRATAKATVFAKINRAAAVRIFWDQYPDRAPRQRDETEFKKELVVMESMLQAMLIDDLPADFKWGSQTAEVWDFIQKTALETGVINKTLPVSEFYDNSQEAKYMDFDVQAVIRQAQAMKS